MSSGSSTRSGRAIGSVVDGDGGVHGLEGVHVAACAIMPSLPRANTHLSALAVAERLADRLR